MQPATSPRRVRGGLLTTGAALLLAASMPLAAGAAPQNGFKTKQPSMIALAPGSPLGTEIKPLITVGDTIGGYRFEAIPDGISYWQSGKNQATVLVNHETSTVPFPYRPLGADPTTTNSFNDFNNSELSELVIRNGGQILSAEMVIDSGDGYHRFCSNFLATSDGFEDRSLLFTNEEGIDWVLEEPGAGGLAWEPGLEGAEGARQIGAVVAYDPETGDSRPIWGMGRHNHENSVAIPGYGYPVLLSGDDSFNQNAAQSQLYAYIADAVGADDADAVWNDDGELWAFAADDPDINDYYDFRPDGTLSDGGTGPISGQFVHVPKEIATGKDAFGNDVTSVDFGYPTPPADGTWQRRPGAVSGPGIDGPQWVLEHWGDLPENNVFQFLRIEDIAFDKRPGMSNVVYLVDSGRGQNLDPANGVSTNGRIWKMVLDANDPTKVESLSILIEGDDNRVKTVGEIHQPDNIESTLNGLLITEDPGSAQQFAPADQGLPNATTARLMHYRFSDGAISAVLKVDQSADEGETDEDASSTPGAWGAWETSGIIDVSSVFGPGKFLIDVQAHSLFVDIDDEDESIDMLPPEGPDWTWKREGGQLLLVTLPGL